MEKHCLACGEIFYKKVTDSKKYWLVKRYCSIDCSGTLFTEGSVPKNKGIRDESKWGEGSTNYRGGRSVTVTGYIRVLIPGTGSYQLEHRKVMEDKIGRKLDRREQVHHINGIKKDNRIENLEIIDIVDHARMETIKRWKSDKPFRNNLI